jgi:hypothetical protein
VYDEPRIVSAPTLFRAGLRASAGLSSRRRAQPAANLTDHRSFTLAEKEVVARKDDLLERARGMSPPFHQVAGGDFGVELAGERRDRATQRNLGVVSVRLIDFHIRAQYRRDHLHGVRVLQQLIRRTVEISQPRAKLGVGESVHRGPSSRLVWGQSRRHEEMQWLSPLIPPNEPSELESYQAPQAVAEERERAVEASDQTVRQILNEQVEPARQGLAESSAVAREIDRTNLNPWCELVAPIAKKVRGPTAIGETEQAQNGGEIVRDDSHVEAAEENGPLLIMR